MRPVPSDVDVAKVAARIMGSVGVGDGTKTEIYGNQLMYDITKERLYGKGHLHETSETSDLRVFEKGVVILREEAHGGELGPQVLIWNDGEPVLNDLEKALGVNAA